MFSCAASVGIVWTLLLVYQPVNCPELVLSFTQLESITVQLVNRYLKGYFSRVYQLAWNEPEQKLLNWLHSAAYHPLFEIWWRYMTSSLSLAPVVYCSCTDIAISDGELIWPKCGALDQASKQIDLEIIFYSSHYSWYLYHRAIMAINWFYSKKKDTYLKLQWVDYWRYWFTCLF